MIVCLPSSFIFYLIVMTMGDGDLNAHYINSWKFWLSLIVFFFFFLDAIKLQPYSLNLESLIFP